MKIKNFNQLIIVAFVIIMISCSKNDDPLQNTPIPGKGSFTDHGFIPASVAAGFIASEFQSLI